MKKWLIIFLILFSSCYTQSKCDQLFPSKEIHTTNTIIRQRDSIIPGSVIEKPIPYYIPGEKESKIIRYSDTSGLHSLRFYYNESLKKWIAICETKDQKITITDSLISTMIDRVKEKQIIKYKIPFYYWIIIVGLILFAFRSKIWSLLKIFIF